MLTERSSSKDASTTAANITKTRLTSEMLKRHLPKKTTPVQDFAKRYAAGDECYKKTTIVQLRTIIRDDGMCPFLTSSSPSIRVKQILKSRRWLRMRYVSEDQFSPICSNKLPIFTRR